MPPAQVGPEALLSLGAALGSLREHARAGADEVLDHLPEVGDRELQTVLDDYLDQVADLLREVDASVTDVSGHLRVASTRVAASRTTSTSSTAPAAPSTPEGLRDPSRSGGPR